MESQPRYPWLKWVCLLILAADLVLFVGLAYLTGDHRAHTGPILYPLWMHFYSGDFPKSIMLWAALPGIGLLIWYFLNRHIKGNARTLLILIIPLVICVAGLNARLMTIVIKGSAPLRPLTSIQFQGNTYHLAADECYKPNSVCPPTAYLILKCESHGLFCNLMDIHYAETVTGYGTQADPYGTLVIDETDNKLYFQMGQNKSPVVDQFLP